MAIKTSDDDTPTKKLLGTWDHEYGVSIEGIRKAMTRAKKILKRSSISGTGWITIRRENGMDQMFLIIEPPPIDNN